MVFEQMVLWNSCKTNYYCFRALQKQRWFILTSKRRIQRRMWSPTAISPPQRHHRSSKRVSRLLSTREWEGTLCIIHPFLILCPQCVWPTSWKDHVHLHRRPQLAWDQCLGRPSNTSCNWKPKSMPLITVHKWVFPSNDWTRRLL